MASLPVPRHGDTVVVAGLSARYLAEAAAQAGWRVVALDLFGDLDTRRAALRWRPIGLPGGSVIDAGRLAQELAAAAEAGAVAWVGGAGIEASARLLDAGGAALPRLGMDSGAIAAVRTPAHFFATLDRLGLHHPEIAFTPPVCASGWLVKHAGGSGGWHIRPAVPDGPLPPDAYFQRWQPGVSMSALCLADGREARLVALNRQTVRPLSAERPCVYAGVSGPVDDPALQAHVEAALRRLVPAFGLRGLLSLDFIALDGVPWWLEVNPRPSASLQLHGEAWPGGLLQAHLDALQGRLPATAPGRGEGCRGVEILFAPQACRVDAALAESLAADAALSDLPAPGAHFEAGEPVCSVRACAPDAARLQQAMAQHLEAIRSRLQRAAMPCTS